MKAALVTDFGTQPELIDLPTPEPGAGEILVRIHAAGVNPFDWKVADGALKGSVQHAFPLVMGSDGTGVVERTGQGVTRLIPTPWPPATSSGSISATVPTPTR